MNSLSYTLTVCASALSSIAENYESLEMTWDSAITEGGGGGGRDQNEDTHLWSSCSDGEI